jgi:AcrR family transcriptional regulator
MAFSHTANSTAPSWQERALSRSLEEARSRSLSRIDRLVAATRELANETGSASFTMSQVATRAGISLKTVYRNFAGKDDLLLALLEDESQIGARILAERLAAVDDPVARLEAYVTELFKMGAIPMYAGYAGVLASEHRRLSEEHPDELRTALAPLVDLLVTHLTAAGAGSGDAERDAETMFVLMVAGIHEVTLGRRTAEDAARYTWQFCWAGLRGSAQ